MALLIREIGKSLSALHNPAVEFLQGLRGEGGCRLCQKLQFRGRENRAPGATSQQALDA